MNEHPLVRWSIYSGLTWSITSGPHRSDLTGQVWSTSPALAVSMPSNIFATTGTNLSVLFLDKANTKGDIVLIDASKLGTTVKEGKNQKTLLSHAEEDRIITTFNKHEAVPDFTVVVSYEQIKEKNYSLSAGQYFDVKIDYTDIIPKEFEAKMEVFKKNLNGLFGESKRLENLIKLQSEGVEL